MPTTEPTTRGERLAEIATRRGFTVETVSRDSIEIIYVGVHPLFGETIDVVKCRTLRDLNDMSDSPAEFCETFNAYGETWTVRYSLAERSITLQRGFSAERIVLPFVLRFHRLELISYAHKRCF